MSQERGRPQLVFWFYWGSEVRVFALSGLLDYLIPHVDVTVLTRYRSESLESSVSDGVRWVGSPIIRAPMWWSRLHTLCNRIHGNWLTSAFGGLAVRDSAALDPLHTSMTPRVADRLSPLLASRTSVSMLSRALNKLLRLYVGPGRSLLRSQQRGHNATFVTSDSLSVSGAIVTSAAGSLGWPTVFYPSNWRDVFKGARIAYPFSSLLMWNEAMARTALRNNPWLRRTPTSVGSTQFDSHFRPDWITNRADFCSLLRLDPSRPVVCYSAVNDRAYRGEAGIVGDLVSRLRPGGKGSPIQILVRLNPAGSDPGYRDLQRAFPDDVVVADPDWWLEPANRVQPRWSSNTPSDARLFANIIEHCVVNVGLPSTVMLDFGVRNRPSLCVGFDDRGVVTGGSRAADFLGQDLFKDALASGVWEIAYSIPELEALVRAYCSGVRHTPPHLREHVSETVGSNGGEIHKRLARELLCTAGKVSVPTQQTD